MGCVAIRTRLRSYPSEWGIVGGKVLLYNWKEILYHHLGFNSSIFKVTKKVLVGEIEIYNGR
jgi:hypothetical protein